MTISGLVSDTASYNSGLKFLFLWGYFRTSSLAMLLVSLSPTWRCEALNIPITWSE